MSTNGDSQHLMNGEEDAAVRQHSAAQDVKFTAVTDSNGGNVEKHRGQASRNDSAKKRSRWSVRGDKIKQRIISSSKTRPESAVAREASQEREERPTQDISETANYKNEDSIVKERTQELENDANRATDIHNASPGLSSARTSLASGSTSGMWSGHTGTLNGEEGKQSIRQPSMNPAQLVQMALELSESRRKHTLHAGTPAAANNILSQRQISGSQHTAQQNAIPPRTASLRSSQHGDSPDAKRSVNVDLNQSNVIVDGAIPASYQYSPATLARAEKARRFFELADKHRRLLSYLPPLDIHHHLLGRSRHDSISHSGRSRAETDASRRSHNDTRERQHNPLQALRNRRLRQRDRIPLLPPIGNFRDSEKVEEWLTNITALTTDGRLGDRPLPRIAGDDETANADLPAVKGHKRGGTADTIISRPEYEWSVEPAELLADTYWTEQGDNKFLLENRQNRKIFSKASHRRPSSVTDFDSSANDYKLRDSNTDASGGERTGHRHFLPRAAANRIRQHKITRLGRSSSVSSTSSAEVRRPLPYDVDGDYVNIGPLRKHMTDMIEKDIRAENAPQIENSPDHWDSMQQHKSNHHNRHKHKRTHKQTPYSSPLQTHGEESQDHSYDHRAAAVLSSAESSRPPSPIAESRNQHKSRALPDLLHHASKISSLRSKSRERSDVNGIHDDKRSSADIARPQDPTRLSVEAARPAMVKRHKTSDSTSSSFHHLINNRSKTDDAANSKDASAVGRFLRGGRIGDMVRNESSRFSSRIRGRERPGETTPTNASAMNSEASEDENPSVKQKRGLLSKESSPRASIERTSTNTKSRFYTANLPSFISSAPKDGSGLHTILSNESDDHIGRQQAELRSRNRSPRFERLAPPKINLPGDKNDDEDDNSHLRVNRLGMNDDRRKSYGFLNSSLTNQTRLNSHDRTSGSQAVIHENGESDIQGTPLSNDHRHWSISDARAMKKEEQSDLRVNARHVARVRTLLLASGIKAHEIGRRLNAPSSKTPSWLMKTASIVDLPQTSLSVKARREEPKYAAELLATFIDSHIGQLQQSFETFQAKDLQDLTSKQDRLKNRVAEDLTDMVHTAFDQADAFNVELSTHATMRTKTVDDSIDAVLRLRRRQFRLLRLAAFKMLEWMVLSFLWWVWFIVVCFKTVRRIVVTIFRFIRWLLFI